MRESTSYFRPLGPSDRRRPLKYPLHGQKMTEKVPGPLVAPWVRPRLLWLYEGSAEGSEGLYNFRARYHPNTLPPHYVPLALRLDDFRVISSLPSPSPVSSGRAFPTTGDTTHTSQSSPVSDLSLDPFAIIATTEHPMPFHDGAAAPPPTP